MPHCIGEYIRSARGAAGLTQEEAAAQLGISQPTLSRWETGRLPPNVDDLVGLEKLLPTFSAAVATSLLLQQATAQSKAAG